LDEVPDDVKKEIEFITVETVEDVINQTIGLELPKPLMMEMSPDSLSGGAGT